MRLFLTKSLIIPLISLFIFPAFSKSKSSPRHSFLQMFYKLFENNAKKPDSCVDCLFLHGSEKGGSSTENILRQCALDLCGPPDSLSTLFSYFDLANAKKNDSYSVWENDPFIKKIQEKLEPWIDRTMKSMVRLQSSLQPYGDKLQSYRNHLTAKDYEKLSYTFFDLFVQVNIDRSQPISDRLSIQVEIPKNASPELKEGIKSYSQDKEKEINDALSKQIEHDMYSPQEASMIFRKKLRDLKGRLRGFLERYEKEEISLRSEDLDTLEEMEKDLVKLQNNQWSTDPSPYPHSDQPQEDAESLWEIRQSAKTLEKMEKTLAKVQTSLQPEKLKQASICQDIACQKAVREELNNTLAFYERLLSIMEKNLMDRFSAHCLSQFILFKEQRKQMEAEGLNISNVKNNFLKRVLSRFSNPTKKRFEDFINTNLEIVLPFSTDPVEELATENEDLISSFFKKIIEIVKQPEEIDRTKLIKVMNRLKTHLDEAITSPCPNQFTFDAFLPPFETSSTKPSTPRKETAISLSIFSCLNPQHGKGIAAHEMGHLLSWMFSQNKLSETSYNSYKDLRACASKRYKNSKAIDTDYSIQHTNDKVKTEEDTADLIAHMAVPDSSLLFSCFLLSIAKDGTQYIPDTDILEQENKHSTGLTRVLFEAIHKQVKLSPACQKVVDQYKNQINFKPCF